MPLLSFHHLCRIDTHPVDLIEAAAAGGFDFCGLRLVAPRPGDPLVPVVGDEAAVRAIERRLRDTGVQVLDIEAVWLAPDTDVAALRPAIETGARLGARHLLVVGFDTDRTRLLDNFTALCELSGSLGLRTMLEFITYTTIRNPAEALSLIRDSGTDAGVLIDALQFFRSGSVPAELAAFPPSLFSYMQICDAPLRAPQTVENLRREARTTRLLPGEGELPLDTLLAQLPRDITLSLEAPNARLTALPPAEHGRVAGGALRRFLERHPASRRAG
ncbi:TIM barrel protein [Azospirillum sp. A26]|uniref:sugar phosphate isomerase/epimerase family protein n=1 Tax=Azospirillum sp. A26 TaxID=3160607 RepID=UPI0036735154